MYAASVALLFITSIACAAVPNPVTTTVTFEDANKFSFLGIPITKPLVDYKNLHWQGFGVGSAGIGKFPPLAGLLPHSPTSVAGYALDVNGFSLKPGVISPIAPFKTVSLKSFWYGCALNSGIFVTGFVIPCQIAVKGYKKADQPQTHETVLNFKISLAAQLDMELATFDNGELDNMEKIEFIVFNDGNIFGSTFAAASIFAVDDMKMTVK